MSIQYERDEVRKRAVIAISGPFDPVELLEMVERHRTEGGWTYGLLYDLRRMTGEPTNDTLKEFARVIERRPGESPRGPVAILATEPRMYGRACTYAALTRAHAVIEVFRDKDEAERWLSKQVGA